MNLLRIRKLSYCLVSVLATAAFAVEQLPEKEEDIPVEIIPTHDSAISFGYRRLNKGPKVTFKNLGSVPRSILGGSDTQDTVTKTYNNGWVKKNVRNQYEQYNGQNLTDGNSLSTNQWVSFQNGKVVTVYKPVAVGLKDGANYVTYQDSSGTTHYVKATTPTTVRNPDGSTSVSLTDVTEWASTEKYLAYNADQIREWSVRDSSQINTDTHEVAMSSASTVSSGASMKGESQSSVGFEVNLERRFGRIGRLEWGVAGGVRLSDINSKASGNIQARLHTTTDYYNMIDTGLNTAYYNGTRSMSTTQPGDSQDMPSTGLDYDTTTPTGTPVERWYDSGPVATSIGGDYSISTPLEATVDRRVESDGALVNVYGEWRLKGAYYHVTVGPNFRYRFNDRWSVSGTVGLALAYVGTNYTAYEEFLDPDPNLAAPVKYTARESNASHKIIPGYYAQLNAEYWVTERTGFYLGIDYQQMRPYSVRPLAGRTARVDLGNTSGWQLGIITRF